MMFLRSFATGLAMATGLAVSMAWAAEPAAGEKVKIDFWHYYSDEQAKPLKALLAEFQKENPNIEVSATFQGRPNELNQKLNSAFATSPANNPAVATVYENWTSSFIKNGYMESVQDHFEGADGLSKDDVADIEKVFREGNTWNGKMVTMPFSKSVYVLYINSDLLAKAGITTAPQTLADFKNAIEKMTVTDGGRIKTYGIGLSPQSEALTTLFFASGGQYYNDKGELTLDCPEALNVLTFWKDLQFPTKHIYVDPGYMSTPFGNQQIGMYIYSSASFPYNEKAVGGKFKWNVAPIPHAEGKTPRYVMQGMNIGMFSNKSAAEKAAAWKLIKFLTKTSSAVAWETQTGYMPIRYSVLKDPAMIKYMDSNANYKVASSLVLNDHGMQEPSLAAWDGIRQDLDAMVDRVISKGADPKTELAATQKKALEHK